MIYSYVGLGKPISALNNMLKAHMLDFRKAHRELPPVLTPGGVFSSNYSAAAKFAGENDMCVYVSLDELLEKSDIIFVFIGDKSLRNFSLTLGKHYCKGKIFCHFSPAYSASVLDFSSANSYFSMFFPYINKTDDGHSITSHIIAEGYGKHTDKLKEALSALQINCAYVTAEEKIMYLAAMSISNDFSYILKLTSQRLIRYALASDKDFMSDILEIFDKDSAELSSYDFVQAGDVDFASAQFDMLKSLSIDEITRLYSSLLTISAMSSERSEANEQIIKLCKKIPERR